jgi:hypothetical protein
MDGIAGVRQAAAAVACAAVLASLPACGGADEKEDAFEPAASAASRALQGQRVSNRDQALQIIARGVDAPLQFSHRAHALLADAFGRQAGAMPGGAASITIEAADNAEGLFLRGETGFVRAAVRFEDAASSAAARVEGVAVLEVSRTVAGEGMARRTRSDALTVTEGGRTLNWSYLDIEADAQQTVQRLNVVSDVPLDGSDRVWLDTTWSAGRAVANGVLGLLKARLTLQVAPDGGWTIEVDNDRDDQIDFEVRAAAQEARALAPGL